MQGKQFQRHLSYRMTHFHDSTRNSPEGLGSRPPADGILLLCERGLPSRLRGERLRCKLQSLLDVWDWMYIHDSRLCLTCQFEATSRHATISRPKSGRQTERPMGIRISASNFARWDARRGPKADRPTDRPTDRRATQTTDESRVVCCPRLRPALT